jgi:hypothetical protein
MEVDYRSLYFSHYKRGSGTNLALEICSAQLSGWSQLVLTESFSLNLSLRRPLNNFLRLPFISPRLFLIDL